MHIWNLIWDPLQVANTLQQLLVEAQENKGNLSNTWGETDNYSVSLSGGKRIDYLSPIQVHKVRWR